MNAPASCSWTGVHINRGTAGGNVWMHCVTFLFLSLIRRIISCQGPGPETISLHAPVYRVACSCSLIILRSSIIYSIRCMSALRWSSPSDSCQFSFFILFHYRFFLLAQLKYDAHARWPYSTLSTTHRSSTQSAYDLDGCASCIRDTQMYSSIVIVR